MRDSERYEAQAKQVMRMAARAQNPAEKEIYTSIAEGWKKLSAEAARNEARDDRRPDEPRRFDLSDDN